MKTFITVGVILVLVAIDPVKAGPRKRAHGEVEEVEEEKKMSETEIIENNFAKMMAVLESFDSTYDAVFENVDNTIFNSATDYGVKMMTVYEQVPECDFIYHYIYFKHSGMPKSYDPDFAPVEPYVKAYVTYQAFLAAINFKVCEFYYGRAFKGRGTALKPSYGERADMCHELFMYMHWFTFSCLEEKVLDFGNTNTERFSSVSFTFSPVSLAAKLMSVLDLDFIMDSDYLKNEDRVPREYPSEDGIVKWDAVPAATTDDTFKNPLKALHATEELREKMGQYVLPESLAGEGSSLTLDERTTRTLVPPYELSKKIWGRLPDFMKIKNDLDPDEPRRIFGGIGDKMIRSNPAEIIRTILEMSAEYEIESIAEPQRAILANGKRKNEKRAKIAKNENHESNMFREDAREEISEKKASQQELSPARINDGEDNEIEQLHGTIAALKAQPGCVLRRNYDQSNVVDYYVTIDTTPT